MVQEGSDQKKAPSERNSHSKNRGGKNNLRMFAANICHFGTSVFSFVEYLVNGCRYFPNILYLNTY